MAQEASPEKQRLPGPQKIRRVGERKHISEITLDKMIGLKKKKNNSMCNHLHHEGKM